MKGSAHEHDTAAEDAVMRHLAERPEGGPKRHRLASIRCGVCDGDARRVGSIYATPEGPVMVSETHMRDLAGGATIFGEPAVGRSFDDPQLLQWEGDAELASRLVPFVCATHGPVYFERAKAERWAAEGRRTRTLVARSRG